MNYDAEFINPIMTQSCTLLLLLFIDVGMVRAETSSAPGNSTARGAIIPSVNRYGIPGRDRYYREWRRGDPNVNRNMWDSKKPLGKAELYIYLALLIGFATVVVGCWLSDNCWSPEPEHVIMIA